MNYVTRLTLGCLFLASTAHVGATPPATGAVTTVGPAGDLQAALDAAKPGDTIQLTAGATYVGTFVLPATAGATMITVTTSAPLPMGRITPADSPLLPKLRARTGSVALATAPGAHHWTICGIEVLPNSGGLGDLVELGDGSTAQNTPASVPHDLVIDRCYIHGDPAAGQKRGIALNSASTTIENSYISAIMTVGQDSQAIAGWNGPGPYVITNNYLEGAGENLLFGGADPSIPNLVPSDITISGNTLTKPAAWRRSAWQIKNLLELKNARRVTITNNDLSNNWGAAQTGYAVQLTPRNQGGRAPWSTVEDVTFQHNTIAHVAAVWNLLGTDDEQPSQRMARIKILLNTVTDVDPVAYAGSDKAIQVLSGPSDVTISGNTITGQRLGSVLYFDGMPQCAGMVFTKNTYPPSTYGIFGGNASVGGTPPNAWVRFVANGTFAGNTVK